MILWGAAHIMLRDLFTLILLHQKTVTGFEYPRACRFQKSKQFWSPHLPTFFKKMWLKLAKIDQKWNFSIFFAKSHLGGPKLICLYRFSESTCSGVFKTSYGFLYNKN
jgi:hypothetical protein